MSRIRGRRVVTSSGHTRTPLAVLHTHRPPRPVVRYVDQIVGAGGPGITHRFSAHRFRRIDADVLHLHRDRAIDLLGTHDASRPHRLLAVLILVARLRRGRTALVQTIHGRRPADGAGSIAKLSQKVLDSATDAFVVLDGSTPTPDASRTTVIPHAHYRDRFRGYPRASKVPGRVLCAGPASSPSHVDAVIDAVVSSRSGATLRLACDVNDRRAGESSDPDRSAQDRISLRTGILSDGALVQEICAAELVAQPRLETLRDLHLVMMALSLDRPVLVPDGEMARRLASEVGRHWVHLTVGPITAEDVDDALASRRDEKVTAPLRLDDRAFVDTGAAYAQVYRSAVSHRRR